jgi:hypothetical protein
MRFTPCIVDNTLSIANNIKSNCIQSNGCFIDSCDRKWWRYIWYRKGRSEVLTVISSLGPLFWNLFSLPFSECWEYIQGSLSVSAMIAEFQTSSLFSLSRRWIILRESLSKLLCLVKMEILLGEKPNSSEAPQSQMERTLL